MEQQLESKKVSRNGEKQQRETDKQMWVVRQQKKIKTRQKERQKGKAWRKERWREAANEGCVTLRVAVAVAVAVESSGGSGERAKDGGRRQTQR